MNSVDNTLYIYSKQLTHFRIGSAKESRFQQKIRVKAGLIKIIDSQTFSDPHSSLSTFPHPHWSVSRGPHISGIQQDVGLLEDPDSGTLKPEI